MNKKKALDILMILPSIQEELIREMNGNDLLDIGRITFKKDLIEV